MNQESTKKFLIVFTVLWSVCFVPSLLVALGSLFTLDVTDSRNVWVPFVFIPLCFLFPIFIVQSIIGSWISYKRGKFKQAKLLALLPSGHFITGIIAAVIFICPGLKVLYWPTSSEEYESRGNRELTDDKYQLAINDFTQSIRLHPGFENYHDRGTTYDAARKYTQAILDYVEAIRLAPTESQRAMITYYLARDYYLTGYYKEALNACNKSLNYYGKPSLYGHGRCLALRNLTYCKLGQDVLALRDIKEINNLKWIDKQTMKELFDLSADPRFTGFDQEETNE